MKVSKNLVVCARCHLTGLASGIDCAQQSSSDKLAASATLYARTASYSACKGILASELCSLGLFIVILRNFTWQIEEALAPFHAIKHGPEENVDAKENSASADASTYWIVNGICRPLLRLDQASV